MTYHVQCKLRNGPGFYQTTWLPERYAKKGNIVELKNEEGKWEDGWIVIEVGSKMDSAQVIERERDYKRTRKASDI
jgi:hypothetical protein